MPVIEDAQGTWKYGRDVSMKYNLDVTHISPELERVLTGFTPENIQVILDFDSTITTGNSESSWGLLKTIDSLSQGYHIDAKTLYDIYHPHENDMSLTDDERNTKMLEWWGEHLALFHRYGFRKSQIDEIKTDGVQIRHGISQALRTLHELSIPVLILSAGVHQSIERVLKDRSLLFPNVHIAANRAIFDNNGNYTGNSPIVPIHVGNKDEGHIPPELRKHFTGRTKVILMGDHLLDARMAPRDAESVIRIGVLNPKEVSTQEALVRRQKFNDQFNIIIGSGHSDGLVLDYLVKGISLQK